MVIFQEITDLDLLEKLKKTCQQLGIEYLIDVPVPETISKFVLWTKPADGSLKEIKKRLVASLISKRIINNSIAWFIFKEMSDNKVARPAEKTKKLIVSLSGELLTSDDDLEEVRTVMSKWT